MKIWCISDSHGLHSQLKPPAGIDMLIFAGDAGTIKDSYRNGVNVILFIKWIESLDIKHKIWIAGNHDTSIEAGWIKPKELCKSSIYLEHESVNIEGLNIFGSPWTPEFFNWAFNLNERQQSYYWEEIPSNTDIIISHGPVKGIMDICSPKTYSKGEHVGCSHLLKRVRWHVKPQFFICGHIHENVGIEKIKETTFINCAVVDDEYKLINNGIIIEI